MISIIILSAIICAKELTLKQVLLAIDCGGQEAFSANEGYLYGEDKYFSGDSRVSDYTYNDVIHEGIKYTFTPRVYFTERHGTSFDYNIPIQKNGDYTVILQFVELYFHNENERQFDVFIGNKRVLHDFSIIDSQHAKGSAREIFIPIAIKNDQALYQDVECKNAYENGKLRISFRKGSTDLPKVDGIVVVKGHDAGEAEKKNLVENWEVMLEQHKQRQAEKEKAELEAQNMIVPEPVDQEEEGEGLISFLLSPIGIFIVIFGLAVFGFVACTGGESKVEHIKKAK